MKILYLAGKSRDAELAAFALQSVVPGVVITWTASLAQARRWIDQHRQVAAVIIQIEPDSPDYSLFINEINALGVKPPVIVIAGGLAPAVPAPLRALAQMTLAKTPYLLSDLPPVVKKVVESSRPAPVQAAPARTTPAQAAPSPAAPAQAAPVVVAVAQAEPTRPAPAQAVPVASNPPNPFAQFGQTGGGGGGLEERLNQALAAAARTEAALTDAERRLADATLAVERAEGRHAAELKEAAGRLADERAHANERSAQSSAALDALRAQLVDQATKLQRAEQQAAIDRQAAAEEAGRRQAQAEAALTRRLGDMERHSAQQLAEAVRNREALAAELADADRNLQQVEERHAFALASAASRLTELQQQADALRSQLADATAEAQRFEQQLATDRQAAIKAAATQRAAFETDLAELTATRDELTRQTDVLRSQLADAEAHVQHASERHTFELAGAATRLAEAQKQAEGQLADTTSALQRAEQQASSDRQAAIDAAAAQKAAFDAELAQSVARHQALSRQLGDAEETRKRAEKQAEAQLAAAKATLQQTEERHASELAAAAARLAEAQRQAEAAVAALRAELADTTSALQRAKQQASSDHQAAIDAAAAQKAAFEAELAQSAARREALSRQLADAEETRQRAEKQAEAQLAAAAARLAEAQRQAEAAIAAAAAQKAAFEAQLAHAAAQATERNAQFEARLSEEAAGREAVERELVQARDASEQAQRRFLDGVTEIRERAQEHTRQLEERAAGERAGWEATLADRQTQIGQLQREVDEARQSLSAREDEIRRLLAAHQTERARFDRARAAADADAATLRGEAAILQSKLDDHVRRFDAAPVSLCRCAADGTITQASRTLARLLGYATAEDVQRVNLATAVFTSGHELQWLIDRCRSSRSAQSIETTWAKKDGSRIIVRLVAAAAADGGIDLAAEDITSVKALEEKLNHAQRLEAVARYASEVAVTCESLLNDVTRSAQEWLPRIDSEALHYQAERLVADVSRASGFLRQLALYGDKQKQAAPRVAASSVLQDLASVLKRVAGDHIALVLPKDSKPLHLDVDAEQVERIFVNVAAYARQRMPSGGRLLIEIAPALVDREFAEKYPSVRPGAHVQFTVTEQKSPTPVAVATPDAAGARRQEMPGVDLGVLQSLVADCGGHLWIAAEPSGDMVLKIHLPRRVLDDHEAAKSRGRWISRLVAATASRPAS